MGTRGRQSGASLAVAAIGPDGVTSVRRPDPPEELTDEQGQEWRAVVNRLPADWFPRETWPMLAAYCRHIVTSRRVAQLIEACETREDEGFDIDEYERLLRMQERESRAITALGRSMRLTQQSTYGARKQKPQSRPKPWEEG